MFKNLFKKIFCKHHFHFKENLYGDIINYYDCRSLWVCSKCGKMKKEQMLYKEDFEE